MVTLRPSKTVVLCLAILCLALITSSASAERIYTSGSADGYTYIYNVNGYQDQYTAVTNQPVLYAEFFGYYDPWASVWEERTEVGVVQMPISSLRGTAVSSATLWFYALNTSSIDVKQLSFDGGGTMSPDIAYHGGPLVSRMNLTPGWYGVDVTQNLQAQIDAGFNWAGFAFASAASNQLGMIAASEDTQGRGAFLEVTPVPEPSSLLALFAGISGLGGMIIRRRK